VIRGHLWLCVALGAGLPLISGCHTTPEERFVEAAANYLRRHPPVAIPKESSVLWALAREYP